MKLTPQEILNLNVALNALDGRDRVVRVKNEDRVVIEPYKIESDAQLAIVININGLRPFVQGHSRARNALVRDVSDETGKINPASPKGRDFSKREEELLDKPEDVKADRGPRTGFCES
jgi:hypothetical protein